MADFVTDCGRWAVSGINDSLGRECQQFGLDAVDQLVVVAGNEVGAPYALLEKYVPGEDKPRLRGIQHDASG